MERMYRFSSEKRGHFALKEKMSRVIVVDGRKFSSHINKRSLIPIRFFFQNRKQNFKGSLDHLFVFQTCYSHFGQRQSGPNSF